MYTWSDAKRLYKYHMDGYRWAMDLDDEFGLPTPLWVRVRARIIILFKSFKEIWR